MAIRFDGKQSYEGCVVDIIEHYYLDGMLERRAVVWDRENHEMKDIRFGYYGIDGCNLAGGDAEVDVSAEVARDIIRTHKETFLRGYTEMLTRERNKVKAGQKAVVVKGRKVPKGTVLDVFWVGKRETWKSRQYDWMHEYEDIAGCHDEDGNKVWVRADYLKNISPIPSPGAKERKDRMGKYVEKLAGPVVMKAAMG